MSLKTSTKDHERGHMIVVGLIKKRKSFGKIREDFVNDIPNAVSKDLLKQTYSM